MGGLVQLAPSSFLLLSADVTKALSCSCLDSSPKMAAAEIFIDGSITHFLLVWDFHTLSSVGTSSFVQLVLIRLFAVLLLSTSIFYFGGNSGKGSSRIVIIFKTVHRVRWEGGQTLLERRGSMATVRF